MKEKELLYRVLAYNCHRMCLISVLVWMISREPSQNRINLSWSMPIDSDSPSPLLGYKIESKTSEESDYSILVTNTGNASITSYSHTGLTAGLTYQYRVSAINSFGESMSSDMVEATIISSDNVQTADETQSQQSSVSPTLQPLQVTLSTDKAVYGPNDSVEISGTTNNSDQTIPLGLRGPGVKW